MNVIEYIMRAVILILILVITAHYTYADYYNGYYYIKGKAYNNGKLLKNDTFIISNSNEYSEIITNNNGEFFDSIDIVYPCRNGLGSMVKEQYYANGINDSFLYINYQNSKIDSINRWLNHFNGKFIKNTSLSDTEYLELRFTATNKQADNIDLTNKNFNTYLSLLNNSADRYVSLFNNIASFNLLGFTDKQVTALLGDIVVDNSSSFFKEHENKWRIILSEKSVTEQKITLEAGKYKASKNEEIMVIMRFSNFKIVEYKVYKEYDKKVDDGPKMRVSELLLHKKL